MRSKSKNLSDPVKTSKGSEYFVKIDKHISWTTGGQVLDLYYAVRSNVWRNCLEEVENEIEKYFAEKD